jgi:hypothetical protein
VLGIYPAANDMAGMIVLSKDSELMHRWGIVLASVILTPAPAKAATWYWISGHDTATFYADKDSVVADFAYRQVWMQTFYKSPLQNVTHVKELVRIDCNRRQMQFLDQRAYDAAGKLIKSRRFQEFDAQRENVDPESTSEQLLIFACQGPSHVRGAIKISRPVADAALLAMKLQAYASDSYAAAVLSSFAPKGLEDEIETVMRSTVLPINWPRVRQLIGLPSQP